MSKDNRTQARAKNHYRQVRLTYTEETSGRLSFSVYVKPLGDAWNEGHCVIRDYVRFEGMSESVEDVFLRLAAILDGLMIR